MLFRSRAEAVASAAGTKARDAKRSLKEASESLKTASKRLSSYRWVSGLRTAFTALDADLARSKAVMAKAAGIAELAGKLDTIERSIEQAALPDGIGWRLAKPEALADDNAKCRTTIEELIGFVVQLEECERDWLTSELPEGMARLVEQSLADVRARRDKVFRLNRLIDLEEDLDKLAADASICAKQLYKIKGDEQLCLLDLTDCPTCGQRLTHDATTYLLEHMV